MGTRRFLGAGGGVFDIDVPLSEVYQYQFDKGFLRLAPGEKPFDQPDEADQPDEDSADGPEKPSRADSKSDWVAYAEQVSELPHDELEGMTKAQLVSQFG